ncbi:DsbA family oxidoreductase [Aliiroseovarius subalbicans]|uniref:DsbA family oxidoreductase n=1 Tax=Aliiroseovarius subalbicans TaxID=2925840 RepID=UPI001F5786A5|nr:DsbA family oxidoreductase [Aliiroseovarius subalbicans]MCI2398439.1 DsbA family oxidoreductase [Aliiroseovarius subalbicans]
MIPLHIFSDPICPWCYIGKARLDRALEARPGHQFDIQWHPFQLNPDMPADGMDRRAYLEAKFSGQDGAVQAYMPVVQEAEAAGLKIDFEAIKRTPNTLNAHRLIHWASLEHRQTFVVAKLFKAYFNEGRDIGDVEVLADIASEAEMDRDVTARLLDSDADADDIRARDADAREKGVRAVPTFLIAGQHVVPGAQPTDLWLQVIDDIAAQTNAT